MPERHLTIPTDSELGKMKTKFRGHVVRSATDGIAIAASGGFLSLADPNILTNALFIASFPLIAGLLVDGVRQTTLAHKSYLSHRAGTLLRQGVESKSASVNNISPESLAARICQLPPLGAKIAIPEKGAGGVIKLSPYLLAEQLVPNLMDITKGVRTQEDFVVQQLTVQGRAKDDFKLVAMMLLMHSDNLYDWDQPSYDVPWGRVAPMIHDGGHVNYSLNPIIQRNLLGRTDFLGRVVFADQVEQNEESLMLEAKAWQRLKLAHDASPYYKNEYLDNGSRLGRDLQTTWKDFKLESSNFMRDCQLGDLLKVPWFTSTPRHLPAMAAFGPRYEADFDQIKPGLLKLNDMMEKYHDQLKGRSRMLLTKYTQRVDDILGI